MLPDLMKATVCYEWQTVILPLLVVAGVGASLLGHNWLEKLTLNWKAVYTVNVDQLQAVLNQHSDVFKPRVGTLKDYKAHIFVDTTVPPKFYKARSVPYPIPKIKDLFSQLAGGQKFTKLDMSQVYQQFCLDDESKRYVINTLKGLQPLEFFKE